MAAAGKGNLLELQVTWAILCVYCRSGCHGSARTSYPAVLPLLHLLPKVPPPTIAQLRWTQTKKHVRTA